MNRLQGWVNSKWLNALVVVVVLIAINWIVSRISPRGNWILARVSIVTALWFLRSWIEPLWNGMFQVFDRLIALDKSFVARLRSWLVSRCWWKTLAALIFLVAVGFLMIQVAPWGGWLLAWVLTHVIVWLLKLAAVLACIALGAIIKAVVSNNACTPPTTP